MLTREEIIKQLKIDPAWEPKEDVSDDEWVLYEEVKEEFEDDPEKLKKFAEDDELDDDFDSLEDLDGVLDGELDDEDEF